MVTATVATLLEATKKKVNKAVLLVIVFKKKGCYSEKKVNANIADINQFLEEISAKQTDDYYVVPTAYGRENYVDLYFKYISIDLE